MAKSDYEPQKGDAPWSHFTPHIHLSLQFRADLLVKGQKFRIKVLIDTGAEVNVIKQGLIPPAFVKYNKRPINMTAADASDLIRGKSGVSGKIFFSGSDENSLSWVELRCPVHFYEANIAAQAIQSYSWLASQDLIIDPRRHGLGYQDEETRLLIPGWVTQGTPKT